MKISPGKQNGLEAVSNDRGVIAAAAMDQRGSLMSAIAKDKGVDKKAVTNQMMAEFKEAVTRILTPHASAILLDPEYGLSATKVRAKNAGLLLAYEKSGYDNTQPGRLPDLLDHYSVRRIVGAGADCVKILLYYTPFDPPAVNETKHAWVERIGGECIASDVPFFLEFVGYEENVDEKGIEYRAQEARNRRAQHGGILQAAICRGRPQSRSARSTWPSSRARAPRKANRSTRAKRPRNTSAAPPPWPKSRSSIFPPASATTPSTNRSSWPPKPGTNFSGVLCGRATWKDGIPVYAKQGLKAFEEWLSKQGVANINNVNQRLAAAKPWFSFYGAASVTALR